MTEQRWYAGVDWASESHHVFLTDGSGRKIFANFTDNFNSFRFNQDIAAEAVQAW